MERRNNNMKEKKPRRKFSARKCARKSGKGRPISRKA
jgi:hypothetical protein